MPDHSSNSANPFSRVPDSTQVPFTKHHDICGACPSGHHAIVAALFAPRQLSPNEPVLQRHDQANLPGGRLEVGQDGRVLGYAKMFSKVSIGDFRLLIPES